MDLRSFINLLKETFQEWSDDKAARLAAALSYYTIFSLSPLLIIAIAVAGFFVGRSDVRSSILSQIQTTFGPDAEELVNGLISDATRPGASIVATIIGVVTIVLGATGVFNQLLEALNTIWEVEPEPDAGILDTIRKRFLSFTMILGIGFLLMVSLIVSAALSAISEYFNTLLPGAEFIWQIVNLFVSFGVVTLLFAMIFKYLPDAEIDWSDVWIGAAVTALLFSIGKFLIGLYLGTSTPGSTYGAAGSLVGILLWVYYSAQILFFGAEFTQVYARHYGSRIRPAEGAISLIVEQKPQDRIPAQVALNMRKRPTEEGPPAESRPELRKSEAVRLKKRPASLGYALGFGLVIALVGFIWDRLRGV